MILPFNALCLIKEFSRPMTRPDWRTFKRAITIQNYIEEIKTLKLAKPSSLFKRVCNHMYNSYYFQIYHHLYCFGIDDYIKTYGGDKTHILSDTILNARNESYIEYSKNIYCNKIWIV